MKDWFFIILICIVLFAWSFLITAFCTWLFCIAFGITFTWLKAFVFWFIITVLTGGVKVKIKY